MFFFKKEQLEIVLLSYNLTEGIQLYLSYLVSFNQIIWLCTPAEITALSYEVTKFSSLADF